MYVTLYSRTLASASRDANMQAYLMQLKAGDMPYLANKLTRENWERVSPLFNQVTINLLVSVLAAAPAKEYVKTIMELLKPTVSKLNAEHYIQLANNPAAAEFLFNIAPQPLPDAALEKYNAYLHQAIKENEEADRTSRGYNYPYFYGETGYMVGDYPSFCREILSGILNWKKEKAHEEFKYAVYFQRDLLRSKYCPAAYARALYEDTAANYGNRLHAIEENIVESDSEQLIDLKIAILNKEPGRWSYKLFHDANITRQLKVIVVRREVKPNDDTVHAEEQADTQAAGS